MDISLCSDEETATHGMEILSDFKTSKANNSQHFFLEPVNLKTDL